MQVHEDIPALDSIVADLRVLRERSLVRLRHSDLPELSRAAAHAAVPAAAEGGPGAVEALLRAAVENLGGGTLGSAATASFGLARGSRDMPAPDRRRRAALVYGVSVERFRKHHEKIVLEQVAEEILKLCVAPGPERLLVTAPVELGSQLALTGWAGGTRVGIVVHVEPVELVTGIDALVVPTNTYLEPPQHFKSSVSAAVRRAGAVRNSDGEILADVVGDELRAWIGRHGRPGLPVAPGTVAPTSPGQLADKGIRRLYHVAVTLPRPGTNGYDLEPMAIATGVRNVLTAARAERQLFGAPPTSIGFPLLGAGRGGLHPVTSFTWLWTSLDREVQESDHLEIHFITRRQLLADLIVTGLAEAGALARPTG
jgi:hypothetical protein